MNPLDFLALIGLALKRGEDKARELDLDPLYAIVGWMEHPYLGQVISSGRWINATKPHPEWQTTEYDIEAIAHGKFGTALHYMQATPVNNPMHGDTEYAGALVHDEISYVLIVAVSGAWEDVDDRKVAQAIMDFLITAFAT